MAKVSIAHLDEGAPPLSGRTAQTSTRYVLFAGKSDPIHVRVEVLEPDGRMPFPAEAVDRAIYVWCGKVSGGTQDLPAGSCLIVERGGEIEVQAGSAGASLLVFASAHPVGNRGESGHVHHLRADRVPRFRAENGLQGALFADGGCPGCSAWLHENSFPPTDATHVDAEAGIHSHTENEVIVVTAGQMRLGARLVGPGTAIAIAADTLYSFTPGPDGLTFLNFRAEQPTDIHFRNGATMDEVAYWHEKVGQPDYQ